MTSRGKSADAEHACSERADSTQRDEASRRSRHRQMEAELAATYGAYERVPLDTPDEWGDLASFRASADAS
jgi:hypothetical protein